MNIQIKRVDTSLPLPSYATAGSVAFDVYTRTDMTIAKKSLAKIPCNIIVKTPKGYALFLTLRSSAPGKKGLIIPHGTGIIDQDYAGENDEIHMQVYNIKDTETMIQKGERIGQALIIPIIRATWEEQEKMTDPDRGGFGSTG